MKNLHLSETDPRPYPVVKEFPRFKDVVSNFNDYDYARVGMVTAGGFAFGMAFTRKQPHSVVLSIGAATAIAALGGFLLSYQQSSARLMGLLPNAEEVRKAGL